MSVGLRGLTVHMQWQMYDWKDLGDEWRDKQQEQVPDQLTRPPRTASMHI